MVVGRVLRDVPGLLKRSDFFCFGKKSRFSFSSSVFRRFSPLSLSPRKKTKKLTSCATLMSDFKLRLKAQKRIFRWPGLNPSTTQGMELRRDEF